MEYLKLNSVDKYKGRVIIAKDAFCSAEEVVGDNRSKNVTRIATMDGFWFDVTDSIEKIYAMLTDVPQQQTINKNVEDGSTPQKGKKLFVRRRKININSDKSTINETKGE